MSLSEHTVNDDSKGQEDTKRDLNVKIWKGN
jgi:hypothetical protein